MSPLASLILLGHLAVTLAMVGVAWFVQVVHYPLFARIDATSFPGYERGHTARTRWIVGPLMVAELASGALVAWLVPSVSSGLGLGLIAAIGISTFFFLVPEHDRLGRGCDPAALRRLVRGNWFRTAAWSLRAVMVFGLAAGAAST